MVIIGLIGWLIFAAELPYQAILIFLALCLLLLPFTRSFKKRHGVRFIFFWHWMFIFAKKLISRSKSAKL